MSPACTVRSTAAQACTGPKLFEMPRMLTSGGALMDVSELAGRGADGRRPRRPPSTSCPDYSETGVASLTGTRKSPSRIACCLSMTTFMTSAGSFCSHSWKGASEAPPLAM